ncbi:MAG: hypothetical protein AAGA53_12595 [Pseudomonadota bacterium]
MIRIFLTVFFSVVTGSALASEPTTLFLQQASEINDERQLRTLVEQTLAEETSTEIWQQALSLVRDKRLGKGSRYAVVTRLMTAAIAKSNGTATQADVDTLDKDDLAAIVKEVGFPEKSDLIKYLLLRRPSLRQSPERGQYYVTRLAPDDNTRYLIERTDRPYLDLTSEVSVSSLSADEDPVHKPDEEHAKTKRANLASIPSLVLAAKAFHKSQHATESDRPYALLIALEALEEAALYDRVGFRLLSYLGQVRAETELLIVQDKSELSDQLKQELLALRKSLPSNAFFARSFGEAAEAYDTVPLSSDDEFGKIWRLWGIAISRFAAGENASDAFDEFVSALTPENLNFLRIASRFFGAMEAFSPTELPNSREWLETVDALVDPSVVDPVAEFQADMDFVNILETMARSDLAASFLMSRIPEVDNDRLETRYLLRLAAFVRDYCELISFKITESGNWKRLDNLGYDPLTDFLDNFHPDGRLTNSGEVIFAPEGKVPYPAINPEEDCAIHLVASGITGSVFDPSRPAQIVPDYKNWIEKSFERTEPRPSIAPYLKYLYLDWFGFGFEYLKQPDATAQEFQFNVGSWSDLATISTAEALEKRNDLLPNQKRVLKLYTKTRKFLESRYPSAKD